MIAGEEEWSDKSTTGAVKAIEAFLSITVLNLEKKSSSKQLLDDVEHNMHLS